MRNDYGPDWDPLETLDRLIQNQQEISEHLSKLSLAVSQIVDVYNGLNNRISIVERKIDNINHLIYGNKDENNG